MMIQPFQGQVHFYETTLQGQISAEFYKKNLL
jgi:hypothetical protein